MRLFGSEAQEGVAPRPQAHRAREARGVEKRRPIGRVEAVLAAPRGGDVGVQRALQEVGGQRHAVHDGQAIRCRGAGHVAEEGLAVGEVRAERQGVVVEPVLLVQGDAGALQVGHAVGPVGGVGDGVRRHLVLAVVRARRVNPARVGDERQPGLGLEAREAVGEKGRIGGVGVDAVSPVGAPTVGGAFGVPRTVELQVTERNARVAKARDDGLERALVTERRVVGVVVALQVPGPVAQRRQDDRRLVRDRRLAGVLEERLAPAVEGVVDARLHHQERGLHEAGGQGGHRGIDGRAERAVLRDPGVHVVARLGKDEGVGLVVEEDPRAVGAGSGRREVVLREGAGVAELVQPARQARERGETGAVGAAVGVLDREERDGGVVVGADEPAFGDVRDEVEGGLVVAADPIAARVAADVPDRRQRAPEGPGGCAGADLEAAVGQRQHERGLRGAR